MEDLSAANGGCGLGTHLGGQLFILVGNEVDAQREVIDGGTLASEIEDLNLGVGNTTVEPGLRVRLVWMSQQVSFFLTLLSLFSFAGRERGGEERTLAVAVAPGGTTGHSFWYEASLLSWSSWSWAWRGRWSVGRSV